MKNHLFRNLLLLGCCAFVSVEANAQKKSSKVKKTISPVTKAEKIPLSKMELAVVDELNEARVNPKKYAGYLEERREAMHGKVIKAKDQRDVQTKEGAAAVEEAVSDLNSTSNLENFQIVEGLNGVARAQLADLKEDSTIGHFGRDGSDLKTRIGRFGRTTGKSGENISYRGNTAREVVTMFLVDDGVKSRSHRKAVLSKNFKKVGVACGTGKQSESLCVIIFADGFTDKSDVSDTAEF